MSSLNGARVDETIQRFSTMYLVGIPPIITSDSAFLSFICVLAGVEALSGYRHPDVADSSVRFNRFVTEYFPSEYSPYVDGRLWTFRCRMFHAFSPVGFSLTHHRSDLHLAAGSNGQPILNAEDFYAALLQSAQRYFAELRRMPALQVAMLRRLDHPSGGSVTVGGVTIPNYAGPIVST